MSLAVDWRRFLIAPGSFAWPAPSIRATTPAVMGVENEVPSTAWYLPPIAVVMMFAPGAETEVQEP